MAVDVSCSILDWHGHLFAEPGSEGFGEKVGGTSVCLRFNSGDIGAYQRSENSSQNDLFYIRSCRGSENICGSRIECFYVPVKSRVIVTHFKKLKALGKVIIQHPTFNPFMLLRS